MTAAAISAPSIPSARAERAGRDLVSPDLFARLARRVAADEDVTAERAARVVDQALAFLAACATADTVMVPSRQVDPGWHAFVLHTRDYAAFCERVAGRFLHHEPADELGPAGSLAATVAAIRAAGFAVDTDLWTGQGAKCGESFCGGGRPPAV